MRSRTVSVSLAIRSLSPLPEDLTMVRCLGCDITLDWHQPDPGAPDRVLGVCVVCGRWHLMDRTPGESGAVLVLLPDAFQLQATLGS